MCCKPVLRFKEFTEEWKEKNMEDIANIYDGTHQTPNYVNNGVKFISVENINNFSRSEKYIEEEIFIKDYKIKPKFNDIFMTRIGSIGASNVMKTNENYAFYVSLALIRIKDEKKTFSDFLNYYISFSKFQKELFKRTLHVAFPKKINLNEINFCKIKLPIYKEQKKIASFLSKVDEKIVLLEENLN